MLAEDKSAKTEWAEFYSFFTSRIHKVLLPEVKGKTCLSSRGWILTVGTGLELHMLNPLSRAASRYRDDIIKLPSLCWDPETCEPDINKFVLSASPASSSNYTVMVMYNPSGPLGLWKPGNEEWKRLTLPNYPQDCLLDVIHYQGQFVAVNYLGSILRCDVDGPDPTAQVILEIPPEFRHHLDSYMQLYLVESAGCLLLVSRSGTDEECGTTGFQVFAIDLDAREWTKLESMGNVALFVGYNSSFSVQVDENQHAIKPNCIYFTGTGDEIGIYHMEDESFFDKQYCDNCSPPLWIEPSF